MRTVLFGVWMSLALASLAGCGWSGESVDRIGQGDGAGIPPRYASVISGGCTPDTWQGAALAAPDMQRFVKEVVLLCAVPRASGDVGPADASARAQLQQVTATLRGQGYKVKLGVQFTDETSERYDGKQTAAQLSSSTWRTSVVAALKVLVQGFDGIELDMQQLPVTARADVTTFVSDLSNAIRPAKQIAILAPPSTRDPSDTPGGDAFDLPALAQYADRVRVMTLDFSAPGAGPTIDPGWAVDAARFARAQVGTVPIDVAMPLYGNDVSNSGTRTVSFLEARALVDLYRLDVQEGPTGAPHFSYTDPTGRAHELWYDDATSTSKILRAWDPTTLPLDVGVVFYGLGSEDPAVWPTIARALP